MHLTNTLLAVSALASTALSVTNTTREYHLRTEVKPHQRGKKAYNNLYLYAYHTGAGLDDAALSSNKSIAESSFLNATATSIPSAPDNHEIFDLGTEFPFAMYMEENQAQYAAWEPVRINAGDGGNSSFGTGFFINSTGFQWTSAVGKAGTESDAFGGWLVCDWWHGVPQLFFRLKYYNTPAPSSCADVNLIPEYV